MDTEASDQTRDELVASLVDISLSPKDQPDESTNETSQAKIVSAGASLGSLPPAAENSGTVDTIDTFVEKKKKRKGKNKSGAKKAGGASGFEEYYVDPPVTPEEFNLEGELYHKSKPFYERIQIAIQRYSAKRKFDPIRRTLWIRYLAYGGISSGPKQFGGAEYKDLGDDLTAADKITLKATEYVSYDIVEDEMGVNMENHDPKYVVDFNGVVSAFLSLNLRDVFDVTEPEAVMTYCGVLRNWLNYLLHHNVCNEYKEDILAARTTVSTAQKELTDIIDLPGLFPGTFGAACKAIYVSSAGSTGHGLTFEWQTASKLEGLSKGDANRIFLAALVAMGSDELCDLYEEQNEAECTAIVESLDTGLEIIKVCPPIKQIRDMYSHPSNHDLTPIGHITARTWHCPWAGEEDLTEEEEAELPAKRAAEIRDYTFWMDEETLKKLCEGMKLTAKIHRLSFDIWFIETVKLIYPSFTTWIANDVMDDWREHRYLPPKDTVVGPVHEVPGLVNGDEYSALDDLGQETGREEDSIAQTAG